MTRDGARLVSVVVPVYCEEAVIEESYRELTQVMRTVPYAYELVVVDDGSSDGTCAAVERLVDESYP